MQLLISVYMRFSTNPHHHSLTQKHVQIGTQAVVQGAKQFLPGFLATVTANKLHNYYSNNSTQFHT